MKSLLSAGVILLALGGCSLPTPPLDSAVAQQRWNEHRQQASALDAWDLRGRVAVGWRDESYQVSLHWRNRDGQEMLLLEAPFGQDVIRIDSEPGGGYRMLLTDGEELRGESPEALLSQALGWSLPVGGLHFWIRGIPRPQSAFSHEIDRAGRAQSIAQDGWSVTYDGYFKAPPSLPRRIRLAREDLVVKLVIERWQALQMTREDDGLFPDFSQ